MNIAKLFMLQSELDNHIETEHPRLEGESRHDKKVLATLVELGELANEARFFKFWSTDQAPRKQKVEIGFKNPGGAFEYTRNPLLEEYVDGIHFLLSIGLENGIDDITIKPIKRETLTKQFIGLFNLFSGLDIYFSTKSYSDAWSAYMGLAEMLNISWEEIEQAYLNKNEINHARQDGGY